MRQTAAELIAGWASRHVMEICLGLVVTAAIVVAGIATRPSNWRVSGLGSNLDELSNLNAWVDKFPPEPASIYATGMITAVASCYVALAEYVGGADRNPPIHLVKVTTLQAPPDVGCFPALTDIPFFYTQRNYAGNARKMMMFSERDSKTVPIEIGLTRSKLSW